eukprot:TRINITY_DN16659_c0_g2_i1.p1 TRINITY_DN16659_c0_g2~~TRINITY_DN16659_c0_g2_i1.p1  ORF type:complete len:380 (+),score=47.86 TRINITY_DN16659_c0_g2_i1:43-1140(+)
MESQDEAASEIQAVGQIVRIRGLVGAVELNDRVGTVVSAEIQGRVGVAIEGVGTKSIKVGNLDLEGSLDRPMLKALRQETKQMKAAAQQTKQTLKTAKKEHMPVMHMSTVVGSAPPGFERAQAAYTVFFRGDGFKGEAAYAALYAQICANREEWLRFYDEKANHVHTERACGIVNTLATIYRQRGQIEACERVLDLGGELVERYQRAVIDLDAGSRQCSDELAYKYNVIRYNLSIFANAPEKGVLYMRKLCEHELKYKYSFEKQRYLYLIPAILGKAPTAKTLQRLKDSEILQMIKKACAQSDIDTLACEDRQRVALRICAKCEVSEPALGDFQKCSRCHAVYYCSAACQKAHWKAHKATCTPKP